MILSQKSSEFLKILNYVYFIMFEQLFNWILKIVKKIKSYASCGIRTRNPWGLRLRNTCAIGCAKKTAKNVYINTNVRPVNECHTLLCTGLEGQKGFQGRPGLFGLEGQKGQPGYDGEPGRYGLDGVKGFKGFPVSITTTCVYHCLWSANVL